MLMRAAGILWKVIPRGLRTWATRRLHPKFTVSAAGVITNDKGQVLLLDHVLRPASGWGVPGGFIETGEQPADGLRRELREEATLDLADVRLYRCRTIGRHIEVIMTARAVGEASVNSREINALGWFDIDDMPSGLSVDQQCLIREALADTGP